MNFNKVCPKCFHKKVYVIRRGKGRCASCKHEWTPDRLPLYLDKKEWTKILKWFMHGLSAQAISYETGIHRQRIMRALNVVRKAMSKDIPDVFSGTIEIDETYIGGQWKNKRKKHKQIRAKRGRGTLKTPMFGILCRGGKVWAQIVQDVEAQTLMPLIDKRVRRGSVICSDTWKSYTGIAARGYVHRLVDHGKGEYADKHGNHINGLEGFWGYLKRRLASKGGIRKERLPFYLAEYVWRYNHRNFTIRQQADKLLYLLNKH
jgi:transposase